MASLSLDKNGTRRLVFTVDGQARKTIRLGRMAPRDAERLKSKVQRLVTAVRTGSPPDEETALWASKLPDTMHAKLADCGLLPPRKQATLQQFLSDYIEQRRKDLKPSTLMQLEQARRRLVELFGAAYKLRDLAAGDGHRFRAYLLSLCMAENTARRLCGRAKQFFKEAHRRGLGDQNPFTEVVSAVKGSHSDRARFITRQEAEKVLDACPGAEWRLLFALSRFGGLRCPSEHLMLRWGDIDWAGNRIRVPSPKTEHHEGRGSRLIPIFPELLPHLEEAFEQAAAGTEYVITRYRGHKANLRTQLTRIIQKAGLEPWPKLFQNLRSTRETELAEDFPIHVVCAWIGNTEAVARKHYLQVTDEHFERAAAPVARAHFCAQQGAATSGIEPPAPTGPEAEAPAFPVLAAPCPALPSDQAPRLGLEPRT
ncbi:MAG TPA: site-specific integrase [Pirellulales bacterium]|nr:site-specific integrase [Pirellulales bacterium]